MGIAVRARSGLEVRNRVASGGRPVDGALDRCALALRLLVLLIPLQRVLVLRPA